MNRKLRQGLEWKGVPLSVICDRHGTPTFSFVSENVSSEQAELLGFGNVNSKHITMHPKYTWANIASDIGLFPSVSMAKNAGWNVPIENGYSEAFFSRADGTPLFVFVFKEF
jgi:hypothetical protein